MIEKLKPCAHCGNTKINLGSRIDSFTNQFFFEIKCYPEACGIALTRSAHFCEPLELAEFMINVWNKRT